MQPCAIIIPCYNEEKRFPLEAFTEYARVHPDIGFVLVNDGSKDGTVAMLRRAAAGLEDRVSVIDLVQNGGKAEAVRAGIMSALDAGNCRLVGFWDADFATPLAHIEDLAAVLHARPEIAMVFGARVKLLGRQIQRRAVRHYLGRIFATFVSTLLRLAIYDTQCGAKIFRVTPEARQLFDQPFSSRWVFDVEIIARFIRQCGYDIAKVESAIYEYPLMEWRDIDGSQVRPRDFFRAFFDVLKIHRTYGQ